MTPNRKYDGLAQALLTLGIGTGRTLLIESVADDLVGSPEEAFAFVDGVRGVIGRAATLVAPTCTSGEGYPKPTFDPALSPSELGRFSELFRSLPDVARSHSPTHSVAALGPDAETIIRGHRTASGRPTPWGDGPFGKGAPWDVLAAMDADWLILNDSWEQSLFLLYVGALYGERHAGITKQMPFPRFSGHALARALREAELLRETDWHGQHLAAFRFASAVAFALEQLETAPESLQPDATFGEWLGKVAAIRSGGYLLAGASRVTITPPVPCARWDGKQLTGIRRDLYARALVLEHAGTAAALVVCDLLGIAHDLVEQIRARVAERTGISPDAVMVACTHAHSTPDTVGAGNEDRAYLEQLVAAVSDAIHAAWASRAPARLGWTQAPIRGLAQSRRVKLKDGTVFTTRYGVPSTWRVDPELIEGYGPVDTDLSIARVERLDGSTLAAISNFGCHPSVALMSHDLSGDFLGEAMWTVEQALGDGAVVLGTNGSAGDVDPTLEMPYWGPRDDANALRLGRIFAGQLLEGVARAEVSDAPRIAAARTDLELPAREDWLHLVVEEQARLQQEFAAFGVDTPVLTQILRDRSIHTEVQVLRVNDFLLVGLPGEVLTTTGLKIKGSIAPQHAVVIELANDNVGYMLTPEAEAEGGYETGLHLWTRIPSSAEAVLLTAVERLAQAVR